MYSAMSASVEALPSSSSADALLDVQRPRLVVDGQVDRHRRGRRGLGCGGLGRARPRDTAVLSLILGRRAGACLSHV
jgi:hypothetical protein